MPCAESACSLRLRIAGLWPGSRGEDAANLFGHFRLALLLREGELLQEQALGLIEKTALAERQVLVELEAVHVAENFCDFDRRAALDHLGINAKAPAPGLHIHGDLACAHRRENARRFLLAHDATE